MEAEKYMSQANTDLTVLPDQLLVWTILMMQYLLDTNQIVMLLSKPRENVYFLLGGGWGAVVEGRKKKKSPY